MEKLLAKPAEVAELLGLSKSKVYELLATGALPSVRIGRSIRVSTEQLRRWVEVRTERVFETDETPYREGGEHS